MRIGIFTECYHPTLNGVVTSIDSFKKELEKRGHKYYIFAPGTRGFTNENHERIFRYPSVCWPWAPDYPICLPQLSPRTTAKIMHLGLDIIHCQHLFGMGKLGLKVGRKLGIPVVYTYHTLITEYTHYFPFFDNQAKNYIRKVSRNFCNACDQVITPSTPMKKILLSYGVTAPIEAIPTGVEIDKFQDAYHPRVLKANFNIPEYQKVLLYISRVAKEKNIDLLFDAINILSKKRRDFHLLMVGGGPELEHYKKLAFDLNLPTFISFAGMRPKEEIARFYGAADIFVFPSITETQGIVVTEAMAAGIPAVAVNKMGPSDIIKNGEDGYLTSLNAKEFADKIKYLLDNEEARKKMGKNAQKNAEKYSVKVCGDKMEELYTSLCENPSRTRVINEKVIDSYSTKPDIKEGN